LRNKEIIPVNRIDKDIKCVSVRGRIVMHMSEVDIRMKISKFGGYEN
jgi:hypothetical protein